MSEIDKKNLIAIRDGVPEDHAFIMATWLRGLYYGDSWFSLINKDVFMTAYHLHLETLLKTPGITVKVACLKDDPEVILGYAVLTADRIVHWVYCKGAWRKIGIAKSLVPDNVTSATHLTKIGLSILRKKPRISFNPFVTV